MLISGYSCCNTFNLMNYTKLKVLSIEPNQLLPLTFEWLVNNVEPTYLDVNSKLCEHLYSLDDIERASLTVVLPKTVKNDIAAITELINEHECSYFRVEAI